MMNVATTPRRGPLAALVAIAAGQAACVTSANLCLPGYVYSSQYDACLLVGGDADDGDAAPDAAPVDDGMSYAAASDAANAGDGGLGSACNTSSDCPGQASYCLKDPTAAATAPGICSIPNCTAADCTSAYSCCDCTGAALSSLTAWPKNVCAPSGDQSTLVAFGCSCQ
jgi:hypothetical protein